MNITVIGDIHGCAGQLASLLSSISSLDDNYLVFLGDYVDVGPASRDVLDILVGLKRTRPKAVFLRGNHEDLLSRYLSSGDIVNYTKYGGLATLSSYLHNPAGDIHKQFMRMFPEEHMDFIESLADFWEVGDTLFSHAGMSPISPEDRTHATVVSGSHAGLFDWDCEKLSVCGHYFSSDGSVRFGPTVICVDTGCGVKGGPLTALSLRDFIAYQSWPSRNGTTEAAICPSKNIQRKVNRLFRTFDDMR